MTDYCEKCRYFDEDDTGDRGLCRRMPPVCDYGTSEWPSVQKYDYCGEFKYPRSKPGHCVHGVPLVELCDECTELSDDPNVREVEKT